MLSTARTDQLRAYLRKSIQLEEIDKIICQATRRIEGDYGRFVDTSIRAYVTDRSDRVIVRRVAHADRFAFTGHVDGVVGKQDGPRETLEGHDPNAAVVFAADICPDRVVDDIQVPRNGPLVRLNMNPIEFRTEDNIVPNNRVSGGLDSVILHVQEDIPFDDVPFTVSLSLHTIDGDAGVVGVDDHVVSNDVVVASLLDLNAVALVARIAIVDEIVDVISLDDAIKKLALVVVASKIKGLAFGPRVVNVVVHEVEPTVARARRVGRDSQAFRMVNVVPIERQELGHLAPVVLNTKNGASAGQLQAFNRQVARPQQVEHVELVTLASEMNLRPFGSAHDDRFALGTYDSEHGLIFRPDRKSLRQTPAHPPA